MSIGPRSPLTIIPTSRYNSFMSAHPFTTRTMAPAREKLLDAAFAVIREKGYAAATVDELCARAGVAKGSFFHHFKEKEALAVAAANHWSETTALRRAPPCSGRRLNATTRIRSATCYALYISTGRS